ncbi:alanine--tRNA ligase, mitochondrial isoform X2 [Hippocampus zosterae]|uniref:alanine--tRNA ligase, mitochondrial isoform X2 n=1 Tax=Hippocampus zosterae TaxID=109293 RepID=UPI00223D8D19|nr:alanine--tRNA ligase, mitochondrial isoform X2 [Hippocampus zosterae]
MLTLLRRSLGSARRPNGAPVRPVAWVRRCSACPPEVSAARVRKTFLDFFEREHGHLPVPSSPVRPRGDPSLLFVNAGMNQEEACAMAWTLLTERYGIAPDRLYVSYFAGDAASGLDADEETRRIWLDIGVPPARLLAFGPKENFWEMGDTGPCGPCTEIHYDGVGGRDAAPMVNAGRPDVLEIWNLVFMEYSRERDGELRPLPHRSVDTGLGLERLLAVLQGKSSNYDTDLFAPLMDAIFRRSGVAPYGGRTGPEAPVDAAYRVVADHARALAVCIADGVHPGMSGAELVLRRILRRAVRFCAEVLRAPPGTLASLVPYVADGLGDAYPELRREADRVMDVINENEEHFLSNLRQGSRLIRRTLRSVDPQRPIFPASVACSLHRDLGFPLDLVELMLDEKGVAVDRREVERLVASQRKVTSERAGADARLTLTAGALARLRREGVAHTDDSAKYDYALRRQRYEFPACPARVLALFDGAALVPRVEPGQRCAVILDRTSFYAEQGGQDADRGYFVRDDLQEVPFAVEHVSTAGGYVIHQVTAADALRTGDRLHLHLDQAHRVACMSNHTATHLLNFALRELLGPSVHQRGSHVSARRLRFDFTVKGSLSAEQLRQVEAHVNAAVAADQPLHVQEVPLKVAVTIGDVRTVDEVYPDPVRVVSLGVPVSDLLDRPAVGRTSVELCCGTHLARTASIGNLAIVSERQLVKGISRIVAVTGAEAARAREAGRTLLEQVDSLAARMTGPASSRLDLAQSLAKEVGTVSDAVDNTPVPQWLRGELQARLKTMQRRSNTLVRKLESAQAALAAGALLTEAKQEVLLVSAVEAPSLAVLVKTVNLVSAAHPSARVMLLASQKHSGKVLCACQVPKDSAAALPASDWATAVCRRMGGDGGGSAVVARGTGRGRDVAQALAWAETFARDRLARQTGSAGAGP